MSMREAMGSVTGMLGDVVSLGVALVPAFLVVDVLFPGTTGIVGNVAALVTSFTSLGLTGLITLVVVASVWR